jgi:hypothetical protein
MFEEERKCLALNSGHISDISEIKFVKAVPSVAPKFKAITSFDRPS